jgi:dimeric dUTPase (all-alpha-NTP-PPase superfamily)
MFEFLAWFKKLSLINQAPTKNGGFLALFNTFLNHAEFLHFLNFETFLCFLAKIVAISTER